MFYIQRASAGSGKTYTLTRVYILNLIAYRVNDGWKLRHPKEIERALPSVLAITFTNKATNEMKQRIVDKLSKLTRAADSSNLTQEFINKTDYLKDIAKLTGATYEKIGQACRVALNSIINNYSLFNVSTIDSFFQDILRTFAFEANLNDSYQLEIDSEYVTKSALDVTLQELDAQPEKMGNSTFWMKILMQQAARDSHRWNIFSKSENIRSIYYAIRQALKRLDNETFKSVKQELDTYFSDYNASDRLKESYLELKAKAIEEKRRAVADILNLKRDLDLEMQNSHVDPSFLTSTFKKQALKIDMWNLDSLADFSLEYVLKDKGSIFLKKYQDKFHSVEERALTLYEKLYEWRDQNNFPITSMWLSYSPLWPYFGLILEISRRLISLLESGNIIQLSDTNFILKKIIGNDDTPFVYERMGNYIEHFLIDEFQDTSEMQWDIIKPLLENGDANDFDSLIIGDPKQSIYRFRNAKHSLITRDAPMAFHNPKLLGKDRKDNTNWRSLQNIVAFNNFFFKALAIEVKEIIDYESNDIEDLYSNVVQYPDHQEGTGYVEIRFPKQTIQDNQSYNPDNEDKSESSDMEIGELIDSLIKRGYHQNDIAILVNKNDIGTDIINSLISYNDTKPSGEKINFISDESLLISSSAAVETIISVLMKIASGNFMDKDKSNSPNADKSGKISWERIKVDFTFFSLQHPELSLAEKVQLFFNEFHTSYALDSIFSNLCILSLPAIIDAIIQNFLDASLRRQEGLFISAFQDLVNEYCEKYLDDPASFMEWWNAKGKLRSVTSPDGVNAVQIMTIHKSKGLEFKCVILPETNESFTPSNKKHEWRWVRPINYNNQFDLPPYLPVATTSDLLKGPHKDIFTTYASQIATDKINMYYVAFTRAKNELYILSPQKNLKEDNIHFFLKKICNKNYILNEMVEEEENLVANPKDFIISDEEDMMSFGRKLSQEEIELEYIKEKKEEKGVTLILDDYEVNSKLPDLKFKAKAINDNDEL